MSRNRGLNLPPRILFFRAHLHPSFEHFSESQLSRLIELSNVPLSRLTEVMLTFAAILLAVPTVYAQSGSGVIPIRIAAGESVMLERSAAKGDDVFELTAKTRQSLALEEDGYWPASAQLDPSDNPGLRVFRVGAMDQNGLPPIMPEGFGDCRDWRWMSVLPSTGIYHIVVSRRSEKGYRLRVSLLNPHDPLFDPGITADRISIGEGLFPHGSKLALKAFDPSDYSCYCDPLPLDGDLPGYLRLVGKRAWLGIMNVEGLKKANPTWVMDGDLAELEKIAPYALPLKPLFSGYDDTPLAHWGRMEYFVAKSWRGLRWLAEYNPENEELRNPLMYMFAAISKDRKYFIWLRADIDFLNAPPELSQLTEEQRARLDDPKIWETFQGKVKMALTNASPKSFKPDLDQLDAVVRSIELR